MSQRTLSIIIPVYNEEGTVAELLDQVRAAPLTISKEILVVNDGSTDRSAELIEEWLRENPAEEGFSARLINKENGGKGSAVRAGVEASSGEVVIIQDADLEYDPCDYQACIDPILSGDAMVCYGSREMFGRNRMHSSTLFHAGGLAVTHWINLLFGTRLSDTPCCYKTFDGELIRTLSFEGEKFEWEPEITCRVLRLRLKIAETPVSYMPRGTDEGKKINWRDGIQALWTSLVWRFRSNREDWKKLSDLPKANAAARRARSLSRDVALLVAIAFVVRLAVAWPGLVGDTYDVFSRPDTSSYLVPALSLASGNGFSDSLDEQSPSTVRTPGVAVSYLLPIWLSGVINDADASVADMCADVAPWIVVLMIAIGAITVIPIYRAGLLFGGRSGAWAAAMFLVLNVTHIANTPMLLSDTLAMWLVAWQVLFFLRYFREGNQLDAVCGMGVNALSTYIRQTGGIWMVFGIGLILINRSITLRRRLTLAVICLLLQLVVMAPWQLRNYEAGAGWRMETNTAKGLLYYNSVALLSVVTGESSDSIRERLRSETFDHFADRGPSSERLSEMFAYRVEKAKGIIMENPWVYMKLHVQPVTLAPDVPTFLEILGLSSHGKGTLDVMHREGISSAVRHYFGDKMYLLTAVAPLVGIVGLLYLGALGGLCVWLRERKWALLMCFVVLVPFYIVLPGPIAMPRYQLPALPMLCVMAGMFICMIWVRVNELRASLGRRRGLTESRANK